jgi:hypothetical protein
VAEDQPERTVDRTLQQITRTDELVERIFRECNLVGNLTRAKLSFGNAIDSAREQGRQEMRELMKEPDYEWD